MKLYLSRHGETDINALDKVCGLTEAMLTEKGRSQAMSLGERVKDKNIDLIISSPMKRAQETSRIAASVCGAPVITDDRLIEQNYGIYEGVDRYHEGFLSNKRMFAYKYPGGESMMQVAYRTYGGVAFRCRSRDFVLVGVLGTVESKIAAKKTHKMEKSAEKNRRISTLMAIYLCSPPRL